MAATSSIEQLRTLELLNQKKEMLGGLLQADSLIDNSLLLVFCYLYTKHYKITDPNVEQPFEPLKLKLKPCFENETHEISNESITFKKKGVEICKLKILDRKKCESYRLQFEMNFKMQGIVSFIHYGMTGYTYNCKFDVKLRLATIDGRKDIYVTGIADNLCGNSDINKIDNMLLNKFLLNALKISIPPTFEVEPIKPIAKKKTKPR